MAHITSVREYVGGVLVGAVIAIVLLVVGGIGFSLMLVSQLGPAGLLLIPIPIVIVMAIVLAAVANKGCKSLK